MKLFIPAPGDKIRLLQDWTFRLFGEHRNSDLIEALELTLDRWNSSIASTVTFPAGTVLKIDRVYIKGPYPEYNSITFRTVASPDGRLANRRMGGNKDGKSRRFWAKLADVNTIEYERADDVDT